MEQLLLVNPSRRRRARKGRTAAQKAATKRMIAANRARHGAPASRTKKRRAKARSHPVAGYFPNPVRRRARRTATHRVRARRYRRNPIGVSGQIVPMVTDAAMGAVGAIAIKTLIGFLPLPVSMTTGYAKTLVEAVAAVAVGAFGGKILPRRIARQMAAGSLTVNAYETLKPIVAPMLPAGNTGLAGMGYYSPGLPSPAMRQLPNLRTPAASMGTSRNRLSEYVRKSELQGMSEYL